MAEKALSGYTYEAYLALEAESETKYEFHDGFIVAFAGASPEHGQIAVNFSRATGNALEAAEKDCIIYNSHVKVHISATHRTFYPDASIVCEKPEKSEPDPQAITNPVLILEVLSDKTEAFDRGGKFSHYRKLKSLREYVLISQKEALVDTYFRTESGFWEIKTTTGLDKTVILKSIGCEIAMAEIYRLVPDIKD